MPIMMMLGCQDDLRMMKVRNAKFAIITIKS